MRKVKNNQKRFVESKFATTSKEVKQEIIGILTLRGILVVRTEASVRIRVGVILCKLTQACVALRVSGNSSVREIASVGIFLVLGLKRNFFPIGCAITGGILLNFWEKIGPLFATLVRKNFSRLRKRANFSITGSKDVVPAGDFAKKTQTCLAIVSDVPVKDFCLSKIEEDFRN